MHALRPPSGTTLGPDNIFLLGVYFVHISSLGGGGGALMSGGGEISSGEGSGMKFGGLYTYSSSGDGGGGGGLLGGGGGEGFLGFLQFFSAVFLGTLQSSEPFAINERLQALFSSLSTSVSYTLIRSTSLSVASS